MVPTRSRCKCMNLFEITLKSKITEILRATDIYLLYVHFYQYTPVPIYRLKEHTP